MSISIAIEKSTAIDTLQVLILSLNLRLIGLRSVILLITSNKEPERTA